ncbi:MAG: tRNA (N6-threonylcarbamoyladenosine(37)-N6)-methyltransferase TrmO [Christensenella sp.]|nr:tRNA (N6-threonylcarbamoyladenosine(37)-N6)-methyltransferase TrmO [Christensenella sp.]
MDLKTIGYVISDFPTKFGIPRQSGRVDGLHARIVLEEEYRKQEALRGLEGFSYIWLLWGFSESPRNEWSPTVRPPKLGGNTRVGVFASRSPYRPNPIGMSSVKLDHIEYGTSSGPILHILGADLMDGTPIYDIKPYIPGDSHPDATAGFAENLCLTLLEVQIDPITVTDVPPEDLSVISALLSEDPRPAYHCDPERVYGMEYKNYEIKFIVSGQRLKVTEISYSSHKKAPERL